MVMVPALIVPGPGLVPELRRSWGCGVSAASAASERGVSAGGGETAAPGGTLSIEAARATTGAVRTGVGGAPKASAATRAGAGGAPKAPARSLFASSTAAGAAVVTVSEFVRSTVWKGSAVCNGAASRDLAQKASPSLSEFCRFLGDGVRGLSLLLVQPILI